jgi:hypothetical protein
VVDAAKQPCTQVAKVTRDEEPQDLPAAITQFLVAVRESRCQEVHFFGLLRVRNDVLTANNVTLPDGQGLYSATIDRPKRQIANSGLTPDNETGMQISYYISTENHGCGSEVP